MLSPPMKIPVLLSPFVVLMTVCSAIGCQSEEKKPAVDNVVKPVAEPIPVTSIWTRLAGEDWDAFLGPRGDGTSSETGIDPERWTPHPKLLWQLELGMSYGGPAVSKGRLLQFDRNEDNERLRCLEAETGKLIWSWGDAVEYQDLYGYNNGPRCMPVVDGDAVYVYGVSGKLSCLTLAAGEKVWQRDLSQEFGVVQNFFGVASTPCVAGDDLLVMVGGSPQESHRLPAGRLDMVKANGSAVVAFDKRSGQQRYEVGDDLASYSSPRVCRIGDRDMGLAFLRGGLMGWDLNDGRELFTFAWRAPKLESVNAAQPVVHGNEIFVSETYEIGSTMLKIEDGKPQVVWQDGGKLKAQAFRAHWSTPVLIDGYLYGCSGRNQPDSDMRCIRWSDGEVQWTERRHQRASVLAVDGYLIVLYEDGQLELVRPSTDKYDVVRHVDLNRISDKSGVPLLDDPCWAPPVLSHGLLYLRGNSRLLCFDLIPVP